MKKKKFQVNRCLSHTQNKLISIGFILFLFFPTFALRAVTDKEKQKIFAIATDRGIPLSIVKQLGTEESGWNADAISHPTKKGYRSHGVFQLYDKPENISYLLWKYWPERNPAFDIYNPEHNATLALAYLAELHERFGNWYQALVYYNHGDVKHYPESTRIYAKRIINAK